MWKKLEDFYDGASATVQAALGVLYKLKPVSGDFLNLLMFKGLRIANLKS